MFRLSVTTAAPVAALARGWTTTATISGGRVEVRVTVSGQLSVEAGCVEALQVWLMGADGARLEASPPVVTLIVS